MQWEETSEYISGHLSRVTIQSSRIMIAGFDLDDTLVHRNNRDHSWVFIDDSVMIKMRELVEEGYIVLIFSNQSGMSTNKSFDIKTFLRTVTSILKKIFKNISEYYIGVYIAKQHDRYRKPNLGLWHMALDDIKKNSGFDSINISRKSFFCGDAGGRSVPSTLKKKIYKTSKTGDFSDTDLKFASNIKIKYITPDELWLNEKKMERQLNGISPAAYLEGDDDTDEYIFNGHRREMIIIVGPPGAGKTDFTNKYIIPCGYIHINNDTCRNVNKCIKITEIALEEDKSVVIDNTNVDVASRAIYVNLAKKYGYKRIRCIVIDTPLEMAKHLNNVRHLYSDGTIPKISNIAYAVYNKKYEHPTKAESFDKIETVEFLFDRDHLADKKWVESFMIYSE